MTDSRPPEGVLDTDPGDEAEFAPPSSAWLDQTLKGLVLCLTLLLLVLGAARLGARTDAGRTFLQGLIEGVPLGPVGRLHVEGLAGDVFTDFQLRRLAIVDSKGAWIEAANLDVKWSWAELAARRLHIRSLSASRIVILRQPVLAPQKGPQTAPGKPPVTVVLDSVRARIETRPDFSVRPGLWDLDGQVGYQMVVIKDNYHSISRLFFQPADNSDHQKAKARLCVALGDKCQYFFAEAGVMSPHSDYQVMQENSQIIIVLI